MDFQLWQGMEPPFTSVSLERNTLGSIRRSCYPATHDRPLISLWVYRMYITKSWDHQPFPEWDSINNRFLEVNETLDQVIIQPNRCGLLCHVACPISFIYRLMRLEATLYHHTRFTFNATSSNPSNHRLTSTTIHYVSAKSSFLLRFHSWYSWRNQYTWSFGNTLSNIRPYKSSRNSLNRRHYSVNRIALAFYSVFNFLWHIWFATLMPIQSGYLDNNPTGLSILTTLKWSKTSVVCDLTIE